MTRPARTEWQAAEWRLAASRINEIVMNLGPQIVPNQFGSESALLSRSQLNAGMRTERGQISQLSGFMAIEGIQPAPELVDLFEHFCNPSDLGVQLIYDLAYENRPLLRDEDDEKIVMTGDLWRICCFFRLHIGLALATEPYNAREWYHNPLDALVRRNNSLEALSATEVYLRLEKWEDMSMSSTPALIDELQALMARINGVRETNETILAPLQGEVSRRELDLVCIYLREHPQVPLPLRLRTDLEAHCDDPRSADRILETLRAVRRVRAL